MRFGPLLRMEFVTFNCCYGVAMEQKWSEFAHSLTNSCISMFKVVLLYLEAVYLNIRSNYFLDYRLIIVLKNIFMSNTHIISSFYQFYFG